MKIEDIKKLYTKTKKAYEKRTGEKYTWVMNAAQQRKGTATVCTNVTVDYEASLEHAMAYLARFEHDWAKRVEDLMKDAKKEAWKNEHTPGWHYGENDYFWAERTTPEYLAQAKAQELKNTLGSKKKLWKKLIQGLSDIYSRAFSFNYSDSVKKKVLGH